MIKLSERGMEGGGRGNSERTMEVDVGDELMHCGFYFLLFSFKFGSIPFHT